MNNKRGQQMDGQPIPATRQSGRKLPREVQSYLGNQLRAAYGKLINEPVPDRLLNLLERLEAREKAS